MARTRRNVLPLRDPPTRAVWRCGPVRSLLPRSWASVSLNGTLISLPNAMEPHPLGTGHWTFRYIGRYISRYIDRFRYIGRYITGQFRYKRGVHIITPMRHSFRAKRRTLPTRRTIVRP